LISHSRAGGSLVADCFLCRLDPSRLAVVDSGTQHLEFFGGLMQKQLKVSGGEMRCFAQLFGKVHIDTPFPLL